MPYIVTTRKPGPVKRDGSPLCVTSGRPVFVATLDEARDYVHRCGATFSVASIAESGGTVGPLPDGTIIEVRPS